MSYQDLPQLEACNEQLNAMPYVSDATRYNHVDWWERVTDGGGDCEDYALAKLNWLVARGWPVEYLRLACCYVETGEYHAVLAVDLPDQEQLVLDNRFPQPMPLGDLHRHGYIPDRIQERGGSQQFVEWRWA